MRRATGHGHRHGQGGERRWLGLTLLMMLALLGIDAGLAQLEGPAWVAAARAENKENSESEGQDDTNDDGGDCEDPKEEDDNAPAEDQTENQPDNDPVIISRGEFVKKRYDLRAQVDGEWISVERSYGNQRTVNDAFGHKWDSSILARVEDNGVSARVYTYGYTPVVFDDVGGTFEGPAGETLTEDGSGYTYSKVNDLTYRFDSSGRIEYKQLRTGLKFQWAYDGAGKLTGIEEGDGTPIYEFLYDGDVITKAEHAPSGRSVAYEYDHGAGELTRVTGSCGSCSPSPERRYEYDASHNLVTLRNADAEMVLANFYDAENRVIKQVKEPGVEATYDYTNHGSGHYSFTTFGGVAKDFYYSSELNLTKIARSGTVGGQPVSYAYEFFYDAGGTRTKTVTPSGEVLQTPRAANGKQSAYILGTGASAITKHQYEYGAAGNMTRKVDADGTVTTWSYNAEEIGRAHV